MVIHRGRVTVLVHHSRQYDISVSRSAGDKNDKNDGENDGRHY